MQKLLLIICLVVSSSSLLSQAGLVATFEQDSCLIGDPVKLNYMLILPKGVQPTAIDYTPLDSVVTYSVLQMIASDSTASLEDLRAIDNFDILDYGNWPTNNGSLNGWQASEGVMDTFRNTITFQFWEADYFLVPSPGFVINGQGTNSLGFAQIKVKPPDQEGIAVDSLGLAEIKDIIREESNWLDHYMLYLMAGGLLLIGLLLYYFIRKQQQWDPEVPVREKVLPTPYELATSQLTALKEKELWIRGQVKEYHTELTHIVRTYLEGRFGVNALESTTSQILRQLKKHSISRDLQSKLSELLQAADIVKFAKGEPANEFHDKVMRYAEELIEETKMQPVEESITINNIEEEEE